MIRKLFMQLISIVIFGMEILLLVPLTSAAIDPQEKGYINKNSIDSRMKVNSTASDSNPAYLVKDINLGSDIVPSEQADVSGILYFGADDGINGENLWRSDGTEIGTVLVKDIDPTDSGYIHTIFEFAGGIFFVANNPSHGNELWRSDGTDSGTSMVKDINPGPGNSNPGSFHKIANTLFFVADDGVHGRELWETDGTESGTSLILDVNPSGDSITRVIQVFNEILYFVADDGVHGLELWRSDGTDSGTWMVKDINPSGSSYPSAFTIKNSTGDFFLMADDGVHGMELWISDGSTSGTQLVKDIRPGSEGSFWPYGFHIVSNGNLFFGANDGVHGNELWISDGTEAGTNLVKDSGPSYGGIDCFYGCIHSIINGLLFYEVFTQSDGFELWISDGTESGSKMVKDIYPGPGSGRDCSLNCSWKTIDGFLYFAATDGTNGRELWKSDGTEAGTVMVKNVNPYGPDDLSRSGPKNFTEVNNILFFTAEDGIHGEELWRSDGTETGTNMVQDIFPGDSGSEPWNLLVSGQRLFFVADDGVHGMELWALHLGLMTGLSLSGATEGQIGVEYTFNAAVNPPDAGTPITYKWQVTEQDDVTNFGGLADTVDFKWNTPGPKIVSVTVNNGISELREQVDILIREEDLRIYIPILVSRQLP